MTFLINVTKNIELWSFFCILHHTHLFLMNNLKNSIFSVIFMGKVTSMTPFNIGFYMENDCSICVICLKKKVLLNTLVPDLGLFDPPHHYIQDFSSCFLAKSEFFGFNGLHTWYQGYPRVQNPLRPQVHGFLWISYPLNTVCEVIDYFAVD